MFGSTIDKWTTSRIEWYGTGLGSVGGFVIMALDGLTWMHIIGDAGLIGTASRCDDIFAAFFFSSGP